MKSGVLSGRTRCCYALFLLDLRPLCPIVTQSDFQFVSQDSATCEVFRKEFHCGLLFRLHHCLATFTFQTTKPAAESEEVRPAAALPVEGFVQESAAVDFAQEALAEARSAEASESYCLWRYRLSQRCRSPLCPRCCYSRSYFSCFSFRSSSIVALAV
jgi:hypothetical protein